MKDEENPTPQHLPIDMADRIQVKGPNKNINSEMVGPVRSWYED